VRPELQGQTVSDERLKIAVFIDFDNIEIGVKTTLGGHFDVGAVLEAMKERGEVVTKVAYGDWTRATDYGRSMSQHAIHMVQRNLTPGGDKNGADINLALDALEMAFTHSHINAFVIVGGDSDFITLVEKLKQYDRKVFVVGGRSFTSQVMQKNCTEFVAYEDILGITGRPRPTGGRTRSVTDIASAMPLIRRAIKLLADREVTPQLGLLKSTLLQLDSSFSERAYGANSFRDFVEKLAKAGHVVLKGTDRSFHVELRETGEPAAATTTTATPPLAPEAREEREPRHQRDRAPREPRESREAREARDVRDAAAPREALDAAPVDITGDEETDVPPPSDVPMPPPLEDDAALALMHEGVARLGPVDGYKVMLQAFAREGANPRFPMYVRQFKPFVKALDESFDERKYGFAGIVDALRFGQREGLFRLERDRQGVVRVHPGAQYLKLTKSGDRPTELIAAAFDAPTATETPSDGQADTTLATELHDDATAGLDVTPGPVVNAATADVVDVEPGLDVQGDATAGGDAAAAEAGDVDVPAAGEKPTRGRPRARKRTSGKSGAAASGSARKKTARPRTKKSS